MSRLLTVNVGSSSVKLRVLDARDRVVGSVDVQRDDPDPLAAFVRGEGVGTVDAVVHRIVHGGPDYRGAVRVDAAVRARLESYAPLAPLHQPRALECLDTVSQLLPEVPAIACFDTAFHASIPDAAARYAVPDDWTTRWPIRKYGFHGLSHAWAARRGAQLAGVPYGSARIVTCHLGAGASLCAVRDGRSVDTTMGFTPLDGLVMATRSGAVDPGLVLWLLGDGRLGRDDVLDGLEQHGGLVALSGHADSRDVIAAAARGEGRAVRALAVWAHRFRASVAAMAAATEGVDVLVFTGGAGEHQSALRALGCAGLEWLGIRLDAARNTATTADGVISNPAAGPATVVVTAREDLQMATEARTVLAPPA